MSNAKSVLTPFGRRRADRVHVVPQGGQVVHVGDDEIHVQDAAGNVVNVEKNTVLTPFGERLASNVHLVPEGGQVVHAGDGEIHVQDAAGNVVNVEKHTVLTPFGERLASNVHLVPEGGRVVHVNDEVHLVDSSGKVLHVAKNDGTKVLRTASTGVGEITVPESTIRFTYADWAKDNPNTSRSPIGIFTSPWSVPRPPPKYNNQTLALSSSMASANGDAILQLTLQYGRSAPGGGPYWTVASWYIAGGAVYHTDLINVGTGESLEGIITLNSRRSVGATEYGYSCQFKNISGTSLPVITNQELVGTSESFESFNVQSFDDYPPHSTVFFPVNIRLADSTLPAVAWTVVNGSPDGPITTIDVQGASDAKITFSCPNSNP